MCLKKNLEVLLCHALHLLQVNLVIHLFQLDRNRQVDLAGLVVLAGRHDNSLAKGAKGVTEKVKGRK